MGDSPSAPQRDPVEEAISENALVRSRIASENALRRAELESAFTRDLGELNKEIGAIESQRFGLQRQLPEIDLELLRAEADLKTAEAQTKQLEAQQSVFGNINFDLGLDEKRKTVDDLRSQKSNLQNQISGLADQARSVAGESSFDFGGFQDLSPGALKGEGSNLGVADSDFAAGFRKRQDQFESSESGLQESLRQRLGGSPGEVALRRLEERLSAEGSKAAANEAAQAKVAANEEAKAAEEAANAAKQKQALQATGAIPGAQGGVALPPIVPPTGAAPQGNLLNQTNKLALNQPITNQSNALASVPIKLGGK